MPQKQKDAATEDALAEQKQEGFVIGSGHKEKDAAHELSCTRRSLH